MTVGSQWAATGAASPRAAEGPKPEASKAVKLRIVYNKKGCIGSGHCALSDPYHFALDEEFHADLKGSRPMGGLNNGVFVRETETDSPHLVINAAHTCTPRVIAVFQQVQENGKAAWRRID